MSALSRLNQARAFMLVLVAGLVAACSSGGGGGALVASPAPTDFELTVDDGSYLDGGKATFSIVESRDGAATVVTIHATAAEGLKAFYGDLFYDAGSYTAVGITRGAGLGDGDAVLNLEVLSDPGVVHLGQVVSRPAESAGLSGDGVLATVRFKAEPAPPLREVASVPMTGASQTTLVWDQAEGVLSWRYYHQGDYNQDGFVTVNDLTPLGVNFGIIGPFDDLDALSCVDGNGDGRITVSDITPIGVNYGNMVTGYQVYSGTANDYPEDPAAGNGSASVAGWVDFTAAVAEEGERLLFTYAVANPEVNRYFRVRPSNGIEEGIPSNTISSYPFTVAINGEVTEGTVPFRVTLSARPVELSGNEPIEYTWHFYDDLTPDEEYPCVGYPPGLSPYAAIHPQAPTAPEVTFHVASAAGEAEVKSYAVVVSAVDALGNTADSDPFRVTAHVSDARAFYQCEFPQVTAELRTGLERGKESANPTLVELAEPEPWTGRANPAVAMHPAGVAFILGGEVLDTEGNFAGLVERGDSAYAYVPSTATSTTQETAFGKYTNDEPQGYMVRLADNTAPSFPGSPASPMSSSASYWPSEDGDTWVPAVLDPETSPSHPPAVPTLRSAPFEIVGSAAAVYVNERPETNPAGAFPDRGTNSSAMPPVVEDRDYHMMSATHLWAWPDCPLEGWNINTAVCGSYTGSGAPAVYVIGGRTAADAPVNLVQKYLPWGFGGEDVVPWSQTYGFQTTSNQVDIWSPYFLRPDTDQFPGDTENFNPVIPDRLPDGEPGNEQVLPVLPEALYGLMAVKLQTGVETPAPDFPNGPYSYVYIFGGINAAGEVSDEMRIWDTTRPATATGNGELVFSLLPTMPTPRAYGQAVFLPGFEYRIALVGGTGADGEPVHTIDIYTFDSNYDPVDGSWSTFSGTLPEAVQATGAGAYEAGTNEVGLVAYCGYTTDEEHGTALADTAWTVTVDGTTAIGTELPLLIPRAHAGTGQAGVRWLSTVRTENMLGPVNLDRYYIFGGLDDYGMSAAVEVFGILAASE